MIKKNRVRKTIEIDAKNCALGRVASKIAMVLIGKHTPEYVPHLDTGDNVLVINAKQIRFTGRKLEQKDYRHHTMYPGGLKRIPVKNIFLENPAKVIEHAVYGMLPKNRTRDKLMKRLRIKS